jgi:hypothetical protein
MPQSFRLPSTVDRSLAQSPITDEGLARLTKLNLNLLIMGEDEAVAGFVASLWPHFVAPRIVRRPDEQLRLLSTSRPPDTILIYDVDTLTRPEQDALYRWMNAGNNRTRIVSTTTKSLVPKLETGAFNDDLYYRLNVLTFDLRSSVAE